MSSLSLESLERVILDLTEIRDFLNFSKPSETAAEAMLRLKWSGSVKDAAIVYALRRKEAQMVAEEETYGGAVWKFVAERAKTS